jgi:WD40 repeat protein
MARMPKITLVILLLASATACGVRLVADGTSESQQKNTRLGAPLPEGAIRLLAAPAFGHNSNVQCFVATPDGKKIITGTIDGILIWDTANAKLLQTFSKGYIEHLAISPVGDLLAVAESGRLLSVYELGSGQRRFSLDLQSLVMNRIEFSPNGKLLAWISQRAPSTVMLWDMATNTATDPLEWEPAPKVENNAASFGGPATDRGLTFHPSGKSLYSFDAARIIEWNLATRKQIRQMAAAPGWRFDAIAMSADGKTLAVATSAGPGANQEHVAHIRLLATDTFDERFRSVVAGAVRAVDLATTPDGKHVAAAFEWQNSGDRRVRLWDSWTTKRVVLNAVNHHDNYLVKFLADGKTLVTGGGSSAIRLWNVADGAEHPLTQGPIGPVADLSFSPKGDVLASSSHDGTVQLWDTGSGRYLRTLHNGDWLLHSIHFSPDGATLATTTCDPDPRQGHVARLWNVKSGECFQTLRPAYGRIAFGPEGKTLATFGPGRAFVWDVASGSELRQIAHAVSITAVAISPDGRVLISGSEINTINQWNIATGAGMSSLQLDEPPVNRVWFSRDGTLLFAHHDKFWRNVYPDKVVQPGTIDVVEAITGKLAFSLDGAKLWGNPTDTHSKRNSADVTPHGTWLTHGGATLVVATAPGQFRAIDMATGIALGPDIAYGGDFTRAEFSPDGKMLALGHNAGRLLLWKPPPLPPRKPLPAEMDEAKLRTLWHALADPEAKAAYQARWLLSAAPKQTLPLFQKELRWVGVDAKQVAVWIAQLDNSIFKDRDLATRELEKLRDAVEGTLRKVLEQNPTLEMRRRVELLLNKVNVPLSREMLRTLRAIMILEAIGTEESKAILTTLAASAPGSRIAEAAQAALKRTSITRQP